MLKVFLPLLLLTGCAKQAQWSSQEIVTRPKSFASRQLSLAPENPLNGVGLELLEGPFGVIGYAFVVCRTIPALEGERGSAACVLAIDEQTFAYKAERMEGGQKVRLPDEAVQQLVTALESKQSVKLYLQGFMSEITPRKFKPPARL